MSGAETVVQILADEGVDTIFGYSGGAILPIFDAVFRYNDEHPADDGNSGLNLVVPANEQGAGFMAAGYARASGDVGVVMVTSGPGATNTVTPVRDSMADSIPLVVISGSLLIETYFGIPGVGKATFDAITSGDQPVLKSVVGLTAVLFVIIQVLVDIIYRLVDPRVARQ